MPGYHPDVDARVQELQSRHDTQPRASGEQIPLILQQAIVALSTHINEVTSALQKNIQSQTTGNAETREMVESLRELESKRVEYLQEVLMRVKVVEEHENERDHAVQEIMAKLEKINDQQSAIAATVADLTRRQEARELDEKKLAVSRSISLPADYVRYLVERSTGKDGE